MSIKVRFAPSPTGPFSVGNARTALFNWLFAKHEGGEFLLRIEDTDKERSEKKFEDDIIHGLEWLGLTSNGEIIRQSERSEIYKTYLNKLLEGGLAYWCFCTTEELEIERQAQLSQGLAPKYSGRCRGISHEEAQKRLQNETAVIRFKMPEKTISFHDIVRGKVEFKTALIGDIIIAKNLKEPLYNFTAAIDDFEMKITHVIRGEDHISNTPKQIALQEALGFNHPHYAHLPLILGPDRKKLSKRFLEHSLLDYKNAGYLPQALMNFLVLLGWHPEEDKEILGIGEMIKEFNLKRVQKGGAIMNSEKLEWLNAHYIKTLPTNELFEYLKPFIPAFWLNQETMIKKIVEVEKIRLKRLTDFPKQTSFFFMLSDYPKDLLNWKETENSVTLANLKKISEIVKKIPTDEFLKEGIEKNIMALTKEKGRGEVLWPLRVALSGEEASPGPIELIDILGKDETVARIEIAIKKLKNG